MSVVPRELTTAGKGSMRSIAISYPPPASVASSSAASRTASTRASTACVLSALKVRHSLPEAGSTPKSPALPTCMCTGVTNAAPPGPARDCPDVRCTSCGIVEALWASAARTGIGERPRWGSEACEAAPTTRTSNPVDALAATPCLTNNTSPKGRPGMLWNAKAPLDIERIPKSEASGLPAIARSASIMAFAPSPVSSAGWNTAMTLPPPRISGCSLSHSNAAESMAVWPS
mmetsp:Transcript_34246/g.63512  ORF Transcript_34246/g.63512 Transcript_34246/m.63512 type:complete len:231 (-) Transcript_34246:429-1121(-)